MVSQNTEDHNGDCGTYTRHACLTCVLDISLWQEILLSYNAVGIFEEWSLSMELFDARVKSPVERWDANLATNPGEQSPARAELTEWAHSSPEVHNLLSADIHIYGFAMQVFKRQTAVSLGVVWD